MYDAKRTLIAALLLGAAGDYLIRGMPLGINVLVGILLCLGAAAALFRKAEPMLFGAVGALAAASGIAWRDSPTLVAVDMLLVVLFLGFLTLRARGVRETATGIMRAGAAMIYSAMLAAAGTFQVFLADVKWKELRPGTSARRGLVLLRGIAIAFPLLFIFTVLLTSADPAFAGILGNIFDFEIPEFFGHIVVTLILTVAVAGFLRSMLVPNELPNIPRPSFLHLGAAETNIGIGLIDALFALFVGVQLRYFFGGAALVKVAPKLTYAEYARKGFFELVAVAALVVPLLLVAEWLMRKDDHRSVLTMRILSLVQIALVFVMLVSAYRRMQLYVDEFGLTELRVYTTAVMFWLAALLAWFAATVLTGNRPRFFLGTVVSGLIVVIALHVINPDLLIVRTNMRHAADGKRPFDYGYVTQLSADAAPALIPVANQPCVALRLLWMEKNFQSQDWRSWNISRSAAHQLLGPMRARLEETSKGCTPDH